MPQGHEDLAVFPFSTPHVGMECLAYMVIWYQSWSHFEASLRILGIGRQHRVKENATAGIQCWLQDPIGHSIHFTCQELKTHRSGSSINPTSSFRSQLQNLPSKILTFYAFSLEGPESTATCPVQSNKSPNPLDYF